MLFPNPWRWALTLDTWNWKKEPRGCVCEAITSKYLVCFMTNQKRLPFLSKFDVKAFSVVIFLFPGFVFSVSFTHQSPVSLNAVHILRSWQVSSLLATCWSTIWLYIVVRDISRCAYNAWTTGRILNFVTFSHHFSCFVTPKGAFIFFHSRFSSLVSFRVEEFSAIRVSEDFK